MRPFEFIRTDVGIPGLPVKLVGGVPGVLSEANGPTHQALEDIALMRGIPNLRVFCPADTADLLAGLRPILADPNPWYIRYIDRPAVIMHESFTIGSAEVVTHGSEIAILSYGALFREAYQAATRLIAAGHSVRLINMRTLDPIDEATVLAAAAETALVVIVEDHFRTGGLYSIVAEVLLRAGRTARVLPISFPDRWFTPTLLADLLRIERLTADHLTERILAALAAPSSRMFVDA
jgi:transketolase